MELYVKVLNETQFMVGFSSEQTVPPYQVDKLVRQAADMWASVNHPDSDPPVAYAKVVSRTGCMTETYYGV